MMMMMMMVAMIMTLAITGNEMLWFVFIRFERRLAEAIAIGNCTALTAAHFYCDDTDQQSVNWHVDNRLEQLNTSRFTAMSYNADEQPARPSNVGANDLRQQVVSTGETGRSSTVTADALLVDFGFIWIVFLTLDALLVTRRIGNMLSLLVATYKHRYQSCILSSNRYHRRILQTPSHDHDTIE